MQGILVASGVIDTDFEGEIKVMLLVEFQRLMQLILLPLCKPKIKSREIKEERPDLLHLMPIGYKPQAYSDQNSPCL